MLTAAEITMLARVLALTDALFTPHRIFSVALVPTGFAIAERRLRFPSRGVPVVVGGSNADRLAGFKLLKKLTNEGLISPRTAGKRIGASLTPLGDDVTRRLVGVSLFENSAYLLDAVELQIRRQGGRTNAGHVLEKDLIHLIAGKRFYNRSPREALVWLARLAQPLLSRGCLISTSDSAGRLGYALTQVKPVTPANRKRLPKFSEAAAAAYDDVFEAVVDERETWRHEQENHISIPLSCGLWPPALAKRKSKRKDSTNGQDR
jgi:hypothetical protein